MFRLKARERGENCSAEKETTSWESQAKSELVGKEKTKFNERINSCRGEYSVKRKKLTGRGTFDGRKNLVE